MGIWVKLLMQICSNGSRLSLVPGARSDNGRAKK